MNKNIIFKTSEITLELSHTTGTIVSAKRNGYELILPAKEPFFLQLLKENGDQALLKGSDFKTLETDARN